MESVLRNAYHNHSQRMHWTDSGLMIIHYMILMNIFQFTVETLRQQVLEEESRLLCRLCKKERVAVVFQPCSHLHLCAQCARPRDTCTTCGALVRGTLRPIIGWYITRHLQHCHCQDSTTICQQLPRRQHQRTLVMSLSEAHWRTSWSATTILPSTLVSLSQLSRWHQALSSDKAMFPPDEGPLDRQADVVSHIRLQQIPCTT